MMDGTAGMGMWMLLWGLLSLALLVLAVLGIVWLVRNLSSAPRGGDGADPAEQELRRRYAAGQIDREEYQQRLGDLQSGRRATPE